MYLNSACFDRGLIVPVHELMHTLGFVHEHNRTLVLAGSWSVHKHFVNLDLESFNPGLLPGMMDRMMAPGKPFDNSS